MSTVSLPQTRTDYILELEAKLEKAATATVAPQPRTEYEVDQAFDPILPPLYRVWHGRKLIGTFYRTSKGWTANPHYRAQGRKLCRTADQAQRLIIRCYES